MQYLDDGKNERDVPLQELRLTSEQDRGHNLGQDFQGQTPPMNLPLPLEGLLHNITSNPDASVPVKTPRAIVHGKVNSLRGSSSGSGEEKGGDDGTADSTVFVVEGQQENLATGGGMRGIRFLRNSTRA